MNSHGLQAQITIDDIPQAQLNLLNSSTVTYEISDESSGEVESSVTKPMRSFTANFLRLMWGRMTGLSCSGGLDINDTVIDESSGKATNLKCVGATTGLKKFGICIGTGTSAVAQADNKLTWDTGFSIYGATTLKTATVISGSDIYFEIQKAFTNNTGSTRTVYEAGLCTTGEGTEADNNTNVLIAREITNGVTGTAVANGKVLTVVFKISSTFTTDGTISKGFMENLETAFSSGQGDRWLQSSSSITPTARFGMASCVFNDKLWIFGGQDSGGKTNSVYNTIDGITWTEVRANGAANGFTPAAWNATKAIVFADPADGISKMWLIGGEGAATMNSVFNSVDGVSWTQIRADGAASGFDKRSRHIALVFNSKMWVIAGYTGAVALDDAWWSTDGISWTRTTAAATGTGRVSPGGVVYNSKMWVFGGSNASGSTRYNSVYYSSDGATWAIATAAASWAARQQMGYTVWNGKIYLFGGDVQTTGEDDDVWYSTDGATWTSATLAAASGTRRLMAAEVYRGRCFLVMGYRSAYLRDVWNSIISTFNLDTAATMNDYGRVDAASGSVYGVTVGTGTTNFTALETALITPTLDGSSSGQLVYGNMQDAGRLSEPTVSGSDNIMRIERDFTNSSGGSITIGEVGLSAKGLDALGILLMRGKVSKTVSNGASVRVAIELKTTV